ncbi:MULTISPECIES: TetR/AcrR family transcriptional regulator [unclassified Streptomyces]|uniref:TetR/AcrR family transcriptional regulator n=1 Tax=unclassified Streptomyces TaxID=2593676 RepID=UPI00380BB748
MNARAPGRPRILSRARIVEAARRIADDEGLDALTVRRVAQRLSTGQASLYRHIKDRDELLRLLAEDVAAQLPGPADHPDPRHQVIGQWLAAYDYLSRHRWAARIIAEGQHMADGASAFNDSALDALRRTSTGDHRPTGAAAPPADVLRVYRVLWHLLLGSLLNAHPVGHAGRPTEQDGGRPDPAPTDPPEEADPAPTDPPEEADASRDDFTWALPRILDSLLRPA